MTYCTRGAAEVLIVYLTCLSFTLVYLIKFKDIKEYFYLQRLISVTLQNCKDYIRLSLTFYVAITLV